MCCRVTIHLGPDNLAKDLLNGVPFAVMAFTVVFDCSTGNRFASRTAVVGGGKEEEDDDDDETLCSTLLASSDSI